MHICKWQMSPGHRLHPVLIMCSGSESLAFHIVDHFLYSVEVDGSHKRTVEFFSTDLKVLECPSLRCH